MSWSIMFLAMYSLGLFVLMLFLAGASKVNERADHWAEEMADYLTWRNSYYDNRRAA